MNLLFPENGDDAEGNETFNGDSEADAGSSDGMNDEVDSNAELTPGNTSDEEYERKLLEIKNVPNIDTCIKFV